MVTGAEAKVAPLMEIGRLTRELTLVLQRHRWGEIPGLVDRLILDPRVLASAELRRVLLSVARMTEEGLYETDLPYNLVGAFVTLCGLVTTWNKEAVLKALGDLGGLVVVGIALVVLGSTALMWYRRRTCLLAAKKLKLLADDLMSTQEPADEVVARALTRIAAGAPPRGGRRLTP